MDNELETIDSTNDEQETLDSSNENNEDSESIETTEEERDTPEYTENEKQLYARLKKAEKELKEAKKAEKKEPKIDTNLSSLDIIALSKANIDDEDIDEVLDYAAYKGISVKEALNSSILKATLSEKAEERMSAKAVNTGTGRRSGGAVSDERLLADAKKGIMPSNPEDIAKLARMRIGRK
jgi:hypothetical protein